ncbi:hypothetical protein OR1_03839 [Geobacter sp. OR-1]|uniref:hypothetical protein n=1 Tax=Geobacter sp. OR-1 TaxID=1266765 RepID=UPI00054260F8|nr:hypothetical protein [Geobacter sp. OR-1]GAM11523.1 hypothetical protein OR1_03839 [Geobacter sp. OR-1]
MGARNFILIMSLLLGLYFIILMPFTVYMTSKPYVEKLGIIPRAEVLQVVSADQKQLVGASIITKVVMYFGGLLGTEQSKISLPPDYQAMSRTLHAAMRLDPYNMDGYYFAQSILVWDVRQFMIANNLLESGMKYRTWDWSLPYFAGFNYAFFLKDYANAAKYFKLAGDLSGNPLFVNLTGRYLHEAGQTEMAISYINTMKKSAKNPAIKKTYTIRLKALEAVRSIENARDAYRAAMAHLPASLDELVSSGYLKKLPADPYGGKFYLEPDGKVMTTSKFAFSK